MSKAVPIESPQSAFSGCSITIAHLLFAMLQAFCGISDSDKTSLSPAVSSVEATHENSHQTTPVSEPCAAPQKTSGIAHQAPSQPYGEVERAVPEWPLSMMLLADGEHQTPLLNNDIYNGW